MTNEQKLENYIMAIYEVSKSQIAKYKASSIMSDSPFDFDSSKVEAIEKFLEKTNLKNWAETIEERKKEQTNK